MFTDIQPPPEEPITLAEAKTFLRVSGESDDAQLTDLISSARRQVESRAETVLVTRPVRIRVPVQGRRARLSLAPVHELVRVELNGQEAEAELLREPWRTFVLFPSPEEGFAEVDILAGFGTAGEVPVPLRQAVLLLVADAYEHREREAGFERTSLRVDALIGPYRGPRL